MLCGVKKISHWIDNQFYTKNNNNKENKIENKVKI